MIAWERSRAVGMPLTGGCAVDFREDEVDVREERLGDGAVAEGAGDDADRLPLAAGEDLPVGDDLPLGEDLPAGDGGGGACVAVAVEVGFEVEA